MKDEGRWTTGPLDFYHTTCYLFLLIRLAGKDVREWEELGHKAQFHVELHWLHVHKHFPARTQEKGKTTSNKQTNKQLMHTRAQTAYTHTSTTAPELLASSVNQTRATTHWYSLMPCFSALALLVMRRSRKGAAAVVMTNNKARSSHRQYPFVCCFGHC